MMKPMIWAVLSATITSIAITLLMNFLGLEGSAGIAGGVGGGVGGGVAGAVAIRTGKTPDAEGSDG
jgi:hypothetical protein